MLLEQEHLLLVVGPAEELVPPQDILVPLLQDLATDHAGEAVEVEDEGLSAHDQFVRQEAVPATRALHGEQSGGKHRGSVSHGEEVSPGAFSRPRARCRSRVRAAGLQMLLQSDE